MVIKAFLISAITRARTKPAEHKTAVNVYNGIKLEQAGTRLRGGQTKRGSPRSAPARAGQQAAAGRGLTSCPAALPAPRVPDLPPITPALQRGTPKAQPPALLRRQPTGTTSKSFKVCLVLSYAGERAGSPSGHGCAEHAGGLGTAEVTQLSRQRAKQPNRIPQGFAPPPHPLTSKLPIPAAPAPCGPEGAPSTGHSSDPRPSPSPALCKPRSSRHAAPPPSPPEHSPGECKGRCYRVPEPPFAPVPRPARRVRNGCSAPVSLGSRKVTGSESGRLGQAPRGTHQ